MVILHGIWVGFKTLLTILGYALLGLLILILAAFAFWIGVGAPT